MYQRENWTIFEKQKKEEKRKEDWIKEWKQRGLDKKNGRKEDWIKEWRKGLDHRMEGKRTE